VPGLCKRSLVNKLIFDPYPDKGNRSVFYSCALIVRFRVELLHKRIEGGASNLFLKFLIQTYTDSVGHVNNVSKPNPTFGLTLVTNP
jgi:hypothetical protein